MMIAIIKLLEERPKRRAWLRNRADRPAHAGRPIVWRGNRQRREYRDLAAIMPRRQSFVTASRPQPALVQFPAAARIVCRPAMPVIENVAALAEAPPPLPMDDIDRAYGDDCAAIMQEFASRMAGARSGSEKRAIKNARKSALAAAKEKAKRAKAARQAANAQQRQGRAPPQSRPRPEPRPG
jgi:hypothetical protein